MELFQPVVIRSIMLFAMVLLSLSSFSLDKRAEFKLAMIQMYVEPGNLERNLAHAGDLISQAAKEGADVVLLPEVMDLGWTHPSALRMAGSIPEGATCRQICRMAKENNVFICCGIVEKDEDKIFNSAIIVDNNGKVILKHRKLNELDIAHNIYSQGDRLGVCTTPWGTFGLMICADATAKDHVLTRSLCYMGADVILSPSSWAVPPDHDNSTEPYGDTWRNAYGPVSGEFSVWIASASNVGPVTEGPWKDWKCIGCSMIYSPDGKEKLQGPYGEKAETILYQMITPIKRPTRGTGWYQYKGLR